MADGPDINHQIIDEFRANGGRVRGPAEGFSLLLLHTTGARSGAARVNPVAYQPLADGWYHNVLANPETIVEIGTETVPVRARVAVGEERERIWARQKVFYPRYARYEQQTTREIPVVVLERLSSRRPGSRGLDIR